MAQVRNRAFRLVSTLLGLDGSKNIPGIDVSNAAPVYDVSRISELGAGSFWWSNALTAADSFFLTIVQQVVTVDASTDVTAVSIYSNQGTSIISLAPAPDPEEETVWILGYTAQLNTGDTISSVECHVDMAYKASAGGGLTNWQVVGKLSAQALSDGTARQLFPASGFPPCNILRHPIPILNKALNNTPLRFLTATDASGGTVNHQVLCMRLPVGVFPPGLR